jgi:lipopolysaccharide biosynthesis glycosyltransferase
MEPIHIVCAANAPYAVPLVVVLHSALASAAPADRLHVHVIDGGLTADQRSKIASICLRFETCAGLDWLQPDIELLADLPARPGLPREAFLRLQMDELLPPDLHRALWLDADVVVEASLAPLWRHPFDGHTIVAVQEFGGSSLGTIDGTAQTYRELGLDPDAPYFNSGVMLVDLARWRSGRVTQEVLAYTRRFSKQVVNGDQDGLNAVLTGRWASAPLAWNVQVAALRSFARRGLPISSELRRNWATLHTSPAIVHYAGDKPWASGLRSPFRARFFRQLRRSGYFSPLELARYRLRADLRALRNYASQRFA